MYILGHLKEWTRKAELRPAQDIFTEIELTINQLTLGKYNFEMGSKAIVEKYRTGPSSESKFERHARTIEVHIVLQGQERIGVDHPNNLILTDDQIDSSDVAYYADNNARTRNEALLEPGSYAVFFPEDAHKPRIMHGDQPREIVKAVVQIPVSSWPREHIVGPVKMQTAHKRKPI